MRCLLVPPSKIVPEEEEEPELVPPRGSPAARLCPVPRSPAPYKHQCAKTNPKLVRSHIERGATLVQYA